MALPQSNANLRTFYACQAIAVLPLVPSGTGFYLASGGNGTPAPNFAANVLGPNLVEGSPHYQFIHGVQSVGLNTSFDFENIFELGQLEIYDNVLNIPEIEITIEKVLDGYKTVWGLISQNLPLETCSKHRANVKFALYGDESNATSGNIIRYVECTGMYINSVTYTFPVDGNLTESVTLVGNHKNWYGGNIPQSEAAFRQKSIYVPESIANGSGTPDDEPSFSGSGGTRILNRKDVTLSAPFNQKAQNVTFTLNLAREDVFEFGKRIPYAKIATYPIEATTEIEYLAVSGSYDNINFNENTETLPEINQSISLTAGPLSINMGSRNFLTSINHTGGDAGGGNATVSRSYTAYNTFTVIDTGTFSSDGNY